jgi:hypothetical protein
VVVNWWLTITAMIAAHGLYDLGQRRSRRQFRRVRARVVGPAEPNR